MFEGSRIREIYQDSLSEWLRRQTRNLLGFARASSNPAVVAFLPSIPLTLFTSQTIYPPFL